eukprot:1386525-Rhodomonas_salina.1
MHLPSAARYAPPAHTAHVSRCRHLTQGVHSKAEMIGEGVESGGIVKNLTSAISVAVKMRS